MDIPIFIETVQSVRTIKKDLSGKMVKISGIRALKSKGLTYYYVVVDTPIIPPAPHFFTTLKEAQSDFAKMCKKHKNATITLGKHDGDTNRTSTVSVQHTTVKTGRRLFGRW